MKRFIPTIVLVVLCIGAFWYASSQDFFREKIEEPKSLLTVNQADIQSIGMQIGDNQIELQLKDGVWTMTKPSALPLNDYAVEGWVGSFGTVTQDKIIEENASDMAKYGLDQPTQMYTATLKDGAKRTIQIGEALPIQGFYYASVDGLPTVYQVSEQALTSLNKQPIDFMDKSPVKLDLDQVQSMKVDWRGQSWSLAKSDKDKPAAEAAWKLGEKELKGSDASQAINKLTFLYTEQLVKPAADVAMNRPELAVEFTFSDNGKAVYQGKLDQEQLWLVKQGEPWSYQVSAADIQALADQLTEFSKP